MSHIQSVKRVTHLQLFFLCALLFYWIQNVNGIYEARRYSDRSRISCENPGTLPNGFSAPRRRNMMLTHHCNFGFKIFGDQRTICNHGKWDGNRPICATNTCTFLAKNPENGRIQYVDQYHVGVYCSEGYELAGNRFAYCNGTDWDRPLGFCRLRPDKVRHECDFESDNICGWVTDIADGFGWKRTMATNVFTSFHTGPRHDHTTMRASGGHYMLMASFGITSKPAALTSPIYERAISLKTACCFQFHYFMYGAGVGNLRVYVKPFTKMLSDVIDDQENFLKFKKSGNQNNNWNEAHFSIDEMEEDFQIVFVADGAKSHLSDIAIDDVKIMFDSDCKSLDNHADEPDDSAEYEPTITEQSLYDTLSCVSRCGEEADIGIMRNDTYLIGLCSCHDSCIVDDNCCLDYRKVCLDGTETNTVNIPEIITTTISSDTKFNTATMQEEIIIGSFKNLSSVQTDAPDTQPMFGVTTAATISGKNAADDIKELSKNSSTVKHPFIPIGSKYYLINTAVKMNWFEAALFCRSFNSDLAVFESDAEIDAVSFYVTTNGNLGKYFWLGVTDLAVEGKFMSHSNGRAILYAKWATGQPDDSQKNEDCVHLRPLNNMYAMNDYPCTAEGYALCKMQEATKSCVESTIPN